MRSSWTTVLTKLRRNQSLSKRNSSILHKFRRTKFELLERRDLLSGVPLTSFGFDFRFRQPIAGNDFNLVATADPADAGTEVRFYWDANHNSSWDPGDNLLAISSLNAAGLAYAYIQVNQYASLFGAGSQIFFAFTGEMPMEPSMIRSDTVSFVAADSPTVITVPTNPITVTPGNTIDFASLDAITVDDPDVPANRLMNAEILLTQSGEFVDRGDFLFAATDDLEITNAEDLIGPGGLLQGGVVALIGSETAINNALRTMQFTPDPFTDGNFELLIQTHHIVTQNFQSLPSIAASRSIAFTMQALSGVPQIQAPPVVTKSETLPWTVVDFRQAQGTAIRVTDSDAVTTKYKVRLETDLPMEMYFGTAPGSISGVVVNSSQPGSAANTYRLFEFTADTLALANQVLEGLSVRVPENYVSGRLKVRATEIPPVGSPVVGLERLIVIESVGPNAPPQLTVDLSQIAAADHDEDISFTFGSSTQDFITQWHISDPDAKSEGMWFRLSTNGIGTLTLLGSTTGILQGSNGASELVLVGTRSQIESKLNQGVRYTPPLNYFGPTSSDLVTLSFEISDLGHSGTGNPGTASTSVSFHVDSINDKPVVTGPGVQEIFVNSSFTFSADRGTAFNITDVDSSTVFSAEITVPAAAIDGDGDVLVMNPGGATVTPKSTGIVARGTRADVVAALEGLKVIPDTNFVGSITVELSVVDFGTSNPAQASGATRFTTPVRVVLFPEKFDAFLLLDDTGTFTSANNNLEASIPQLLSELAANFGTLDFLGLGVGRFEDYGNFVDAGTTTLGDNNLPFILNQPIVTQDATGSTVAFSNAIRSALLREADGSGGDLPESLTEALFQLATGLGFDGNSDGDKTDSSNAGTLRAQNTPTNPANTDVPTYQSLNPANLQGGMLPPASLTENGTRGRGGGGFREGSIPLVVAATDDGTRFQEEISGGTPTIVSRLGDQISFLDLTFAGIEGTPFDDGARITDTLNALSALHPLTTVIGLGPQNVEETMLRAFARATGAVNETGISIPRGQSRPAVPTDGGQQDGSLYLPFNISDSGSFASAIGDAIRAGVRLHATMPLNLIYGAPAVSLFTTGMTGTNAATVPVRSTATAINVSHASIPAGTPAAVFQTALSGTNAATPPQADRLQMSYNVPNGTYSVELYFAEIEGQAAGQRKFNIAIEGQNKENNFDVADAAGGVNRGIVRTYSVTVTDGHLNIDLTRVLGSAPIVSGVRLLATAPPKVIDVMVGGAGWAPGVEYAFSKIVPIGKQLAPIYIQGANRISMQFSEPVDVDRSFLELHVSNGGVRSPLFGPAGFEYDPVHYTATWNFENLPADKYRLKLSDDIQDIASSALDGEWDNLLGPNANNNGPATSITPDNYADDFAGRTLRSGTGNPGGAFEFSFSVLPGDFNQNGVIDVADDDGPVVKDGDGDGVIENGPSGDDTLIAANMINSPSVYSKSFIASRPRGDFNDDEKVTSLDYAVWRMSYGFGQDLRADANQNGVIDIGDWNAYLDHLNQYSAWYTGTFPLDGGGAGGGTPIFDPYNVPRVANVTIRSSLATESWQLPYSFVNHVGSGEQLRTVPVGGADTISITFTEDVNVSANMLKVTGMRTANRPALAEFSYDIGTMTATWRFTTWSLGDQYLISLSDDVTDIEGNALDGDWTNPIHLSTTNSQVSEFPSGDGYTGGDFNFVAALLPGDANLDLMVDGADFAIWSALLGADGIFQDGDFDGDGLITSVDGDLWYEHVGSNLQQLSLLADLNGDWKVDESDSTILFNNYQLFLSNPTHAQGNLDGDSDIDLEDLDLMFAQYGMEVVS